MPVYLADHSGRNRGPTSLENTPEYLNIAGQHPPDLLYISEPNQAGVARVRDENGTGPSHRRAVAFLGDSRHDDPLEPNRPYPPHLASRAGRQAALPDPLGRADARASAGRSSARCRGRGDRNVIGSHGGSYALYRALAVSSGALDPIRRPDLTNTHPAATIGPFPQWTRPAAHRLARSVGTSGRGDLRRARSPRASTSARASR